jgi:hypothetical protein
MGLFARPLTASDGAGNAASSSAGRGLSRQASRNRVIGGSRPVMVTGWEWLTGRRRWLARSLRFKVWHDAGCGQGDASDVRPSKSNFVA